jgi:hypothetical protein
MEKLGLALCGVIVGIFGLGIAAFLFTLLYAVVGILFAILR